MSEIPTTDLDSAHQALDHMLKKPQDNHRSHRDDNRPHNRSTLVQADMGRRNRRMGLRRIGCGRS
jgi:hypothetical protein